MSTPPNTNEPSSAQSSSQYLGLPYSASKSAIQVAPRPTTRAEKTQPLTHHIHGKHRTESTGLELTWLAQKARLSSTHRLWRPRANAIGVLVVAHPRGKHQLRFHAQPLPATVRQLPHEDSEINHVYFHQRYRGITFSPFNRFSLPQVMPFERPLLLRRIHPSRESPASPRFLCRPRIPGRCS